MGLGLQGYLAHTKQRPTGTLHKDYAKGPTVVPGGGAVSYEQGTPVWDRGTLLTRSARASQSFEYKVPGFWLQVQDVGFTVEGSSLGVEG